MDGGVGLCGRPEHLSSLAALLQNVTRMTICCPEAEGHHDSAWIETESVSALSTAKFQQ
jgi:hypothetical protein